MSTRFENILAEKGITLIALVITIIILLILTGITIVTITGENGLLERAAHAADETLIAREKEQIKLEMLGSMNEDGTLNFNTLKDNLENNLNVNTSGTGFPLTVTFEDTENSYTISGTGSIEAVINAPITLSETSGDVVAGNTVSFTISYEGNCTLDVISSNTSIATVTLSESTVTATGVAGGAATITVREISGGTVSNSVTYSLTVRTKVYEISAGSPKYHNKLGSAVSAVTAGGTIKVVANSSESGNISIGKNVTINTNGKTITRTSGTITVTAGTVTISGSGGISNTNASATAIKVTGGTFRTSGTPLIKAKMIAINGTGGTISIQGGYIWSTACTDNSTIKITGSSNLTINNSYVYCGDSNNSSAIWFDSSSTGNLTINGSSHIGNQGLSGNGSDRGPTISFYSTGNINMTGTAEVCADDKAGSPIRCHSRCTVSIGGTASLYRLNADGNGCIWASAANTSISIDTEGWIYSADNYCIDIMGNNGEAVNGSIEVTKGKLVSKSKNMTYSNGAYEPDYKASGSTGTRTFNYMSAYNTINTKNVSDVYYYMK